MRKPFATLVAALMLMLCAASFAQEAPVLKVWPGKVPGETAQTGPERIVPRKPNEMPIKLITDVSEPTLTLYKAPKDKDTGAAILICPGGGYSVLAWDLEGTEVAQWLNSIGVSGIILKYRVPARKGLPNYLPPLQDAQRAMSLVRSKASEWNIDPKRIGMLGFSAGGNLTATACTNFTQRSYDPIDDIDKISCRPDFAVLVYPAWLIDDKTHELKPQFKVDANTPPMFFAHAADDGITADNSAILFMALHKLKIPAELHIYSTGGHGFGLRPTDKPCSTWPANCAAWLKSLGLLHPKQ